MTTFSEMVEFLKNQKNCRVNCKWFTIPDLHDYLHKETRIVETMDIGDRKSSKECQRIKNTIQMVIQAIQEGNTEPIGTRHKIDDPHFNQ
jgi:uncharacterized protein involved in propanediol utilization